MATVQAFWVHGTAVDIEREGYFISKAKTGFGTCYRSHGASWFHFAVPTPVIHDGARASVAKVFVLYRTELSAKITNIHVYDAGAKIAWWDGLALAGKHDTGLDGQNSWTLSSPVAMKFGLGVSVCVDFGGPTPAGVPAIWFVSAGADFQTP